MTYTIDQIEQWMKEGQAISPTVAKELVEENISLRKLIAEVVELVVEWQFDTRLDPTDFLQWKDRAQGIKSE
jgi:hypothetical protein